MSAIDQLLDGRPLRIVDIGASGGIHPRWLALTSRVTPILFEPDPRAQEELKRRSPPGTVVIGSALADTPGPLSLHLCRKQKVSSVYLPDTELLARFPYPERFAVLRTIDLQADTLDGQLRAAGLTEIDFIKVDTQGYELPILRGGADTLDTALGFEIEVAFIPIYRGQSLFGDVDAFARAHGFSLVDLRRTFWRRGNSSEYGRNKGQLATADALYLRDPESLMATADASPERIARAAGVYLAYGYPDLAHTLLHRAQRDSLLDVQSLRLARAALARFKDDRMPEFPGRQQLRRFLRRLAHLFQDRGPYTGADSELGNLHFPRR